MRNTALALSLFVLLTLPASLIITSAPVNISLDDGEEIVNIDVCNGGEELPGGWMPAMPSPCPTVVNVVQEPGIPAIPVKFASIPPATEDPPPKTCPV